MPRFSRRDVIGAGLGLGAVGAAGYGLGWFAPTEAPGTRAVSFGAPLPKARNDLNLLILMVDQERAWETLPTNLAMPNHHRIAEKGTMFTNMNVTSPLCTPSRSVFWTGQHVQHTKVQDNTNVPLIGRPLNPAIPTFGHMLRDAGFYTAYKGKWHLHDLPQHAAWEQAPDRATALEPYGYADYGWGPELIDSQHGWKFDGRIAQDAAQWLTGKAPRLDQPWALTVSFVNPHDIMYFDATGDQAGTRVQNSFPGPVLPMPDDPLYHSSESFGLPRDFRASDYPGRIATQADYETFMDDFYGSMPHNDIVAWTRFSDYYYSCIRDVDRHLGTVLDALEQSGQAENTIIVLTSDHGEMGGVHGLRQKGPWMYRENLNVPFVVSHPDARTSRKNTGLVSALDFSPTMLGLAGMGQSEVTGRYPAMKGRDVSGELAAGSTERSRSGEGALITYSVIHHSDPHFARAGLKNQATDSLTEKLRNSADAGVLPDLGKRSFMRGIVTDNYKFGRYFSPRDHHRPETLDDLKARNDLELFDLQADPGESENLIATGRVSDDVILALNNRLNALIDAEIGPDDGRDMPGPAFYWRG
ncbi:MAG: sulfatase-like hydrolase/transferase [Pseudomonadota bacterium]